MTAVALDAMGGDFAPAATVEGAIRAARLGVEVILVGDEARIGAELDRIAPGAAAPRIVHAPDAIGMDEHAAAEVRRRRETSVYVATDLVKRGEAAAVVSMGNTGGAMATAFLVLGRLPRVERPALAAVLPTPAGPTLLLDVGANADARPSHLVQFAHLGGAYMETVHGVERPRVGLLSIGEEPGKGSTLVVETHARLAADPDIEFAGNVEGREVMEGRVDVIVTDGFTGNVTLKVLEGAVSLMFGHLRDAAAGSLRGRVGGLLLLPSLRGIREQLDYRRHGAAPLLGIDGGAFIGHGRSDGEAVEHALVNAAGAVEQGLIERLRASVADGRGAAEGRVEPGAGG